MISDKQWTSFLKQYFATLHTKVMQVSFDKSLSDAQLERLRDATLRSIRSDFDVWSVASHVWHIHACGGGEYPVKCSHKLYMSAECVETPDGLDTMLHKRKQTQQRGHVKKQLKAQVTWTNQQSDSRSSLQTTKTCKSSKSIKLAETTQMTRTSVPTPEQISMQACNSGALSFLPVLR
jgi:hypothetical protein